jgi:hypothetical protein
MIMPVERMVCGVRRETRKEQTMEIYIRPSFVGPTNKKRLTIECVIGRDG